MLSPENGGMSEEELAKYMTPKQEEASEAHRKLFDKPGRDGQIEIKKVSSLNAWDKEDEVLSGIIDEVNFQVREEYVGEGEDRTYSGSMDTMDLSASDAFKLWFKYYDTGIANSQVKALASEAREEQGKVHDERVRQEQHETRSRELASQAEQQREKERPQAEAYALKLEKLLGKPPTEK